MAYTYNERGWLRTQNTNGNVSSLDLRYNQPDAGISAQYNGNISQLNYLTTKVSAPGNRSFSYIYDALNRLTNAGFTGGTNGDALNEQVNYDMMGNITQLVRSGTGGGTLNYTSYTGNQLNTVTGYSPRSYQYDPNGNATSDGQGQQIDYNQLNLPQDTRRNNTIVATYTYDATGQKLRNTGSDGSWDYIGGIIYHNNAIAFINTAEGRIANNNGMYNYEYNLQDHLGNNRVSFDIYNGAPRVIQEDEYYSFGLRKPTGGFDLSNNNRYLYNGKEIQTDLANQYDYGARFYDPVIGRWTSIDPLAEQGRRETPYGYAFDDPMRFTDPDGMWPDGPEDDPFIYGKLFLTFAYDIKHAIFNTASRAVGSSYREKYKVENGHEVFESEIYKEQAPKTLGQAGVQAVSALGDALAVIPEGGSSVKLLAKSTTEATVGREAGEILAANKVAGKTGEDFLNNTFGGQPQVSMNTNKGRRVVDNLTSSGVAQESKVGRTSLSKLVKTQISKDAELLKDPTSGVSGVEWHFFSGATGSGPTKPLQKALQGLSIPFVKH